MNDVISIFSRCPSAAVLDLIWVMLDHPRSAIAGLSSVLKFGLDLDPIYSFGDIAIFYFAEIVYSRPFLEVGGEVGGIFSQIWSPIVLTPQNDHPCAETRRLSHKA